MKEINAGGLSCPTPVLLTKSAIEKENPSEIRVIVDNKAALENVSRFLRSRNFEVSAEEYSGLFHVIGKQQLTSPSPYPEEKQETGKNRIMVMVSADRIGHGDDDLGAKLMVSFLKTLKEMGSDLWRLVFVNSGVRLTVEGSEVLPILKESEADGVHIMVCGTCLNHFNLLDKKKVGETTNMLDIVTALQLADKVINI